MIYLRVTFPLLELLFIENIYYFYKDYTEIIQIKLIDDKTIMNEVCFYVTHIKV